MEHSTDIIQIDMPRPVHEELERWKAVKFPVPIADYGFCEPNKILQKEVYTYAKEDNFNALFGLLSDKLEHVSSEEVLNIIFKHVAASGNSLLHVAASHGSEGVIQLLCHHFPLLISRVNFLGDNALHLAARAGRFDTIQILVNHVKMDPHKTLELASLLRMKNNKGNTPLHDAVIKGCREVACFLLYEDLEVSYFKNKEDKSPLYLAVESCDGEMLASVIEAMPEGNLEKLAVGKPDIILPEDKKGGNLLHVAASMGFLSGARLLVSRCPVAASQRNEEGNLPIHVACQKGHLEVVRELLPYWLDPMDFLNEKGQNILHVAAGSGQMKIVDEILRNRDLEALINEKDYDGNTPLHLAAMYCRSEIVQALVSDKRVDKKIVNNEKLKPSGVVKLLQGGRFEAPKSDGMNKLIDTKHEDDAARRVWNKSQEAAVRKMRKVLVEADDKTEFDINLIFNSPRTTLTREELDRGVGNLLVVAVLVVGVTFAGAITVPGSGRDLNSDSSKYLMKAYIIFDMVAMNLSLIAAIILCQISLGRTSDVRISMDMATYFNFYSLLCLGLAFTSILAITVQERTGFCIRYQICFLLYQFFLSFRLLVSTSYSLLYFVLASPFKLMARMKRSDPVQTG